MSTPTKITIAAAILLASLSGAAAQGTLKPKSALTAEVSQQLPDNTINAITPSAVRQVLNDTIASFQPPIVVNAQTGTSYTFVAADYGKLVTFSNTSPVAAGLPQATGSFSPWNVFVVNLGTGTVTVTPSGSNINGASTLAVQPGGSFQIVSDGVNYQLGSGLIANSNLANMAAGTHKCKPLGATAGAPQDCSYPIINVTDAPYSAACNGTGDDSTAINNAIIAAAGGIVEIPLTGNCRITANLNIGNGTTSAVSSRAGVILRGVGMPLSAPGLPFFNGYSTPTGPKITWAGGTNSNVIQVNGPLQGYGIQNLVIDCASTAGVNGILATSAALGDNRNLTVLNCGASGIASTTNPLGGYTGVGNVDANGTSWTNISILVPAVAGAKGFLCNGDAGGTSDTDYNQITNMLIRTPSAAANFGFYMQTCDGNNFYNIRASGFTGAGVGMQFDYTANANFPNSNNFYTYEIGGSPNFVNNGSPSANVLLSKNKFYGLIESNLALAPAVAGTIATDGVWNTFTPSLTCSAGTATFTLNSAKFKQPGSKITLIELDFTIATGTTCTQVSFNLPNTPNSNGAIAGVNGTTGVLANCIIKVSGAAGQCGQVGLAAWAVGNETVFSGSY